ncbi:matrix metalloproteinase [Frankliniella occidentalis]|uniref:Matrix metalloproteinase-14 isoform X3 n=1 Tax=Frankliniella occidentalis TaxID=133901 RepID=A0A9C6WWC3_FRAOC|nr:matrix metalloproteinase-14 isoform X3 [Frankliniella occidentalis]KAE8746417.1 matrix metalloproteinase [Frankliniella occidentalis]
MTMALYGLLLVSAATVGTALSAGTSSYADSVATDTTAMIYLSQYGYLSPSVKNPAMSHLMSEESVSKAISEFQSFVGLNITGNLDTETLKMMSIPRCGVKDKVGVASDLRSKRYALQGSRWRVKNLTYKISKYPSRLRKRDVDEEIRQAFSLWSDYTDLTFTPKQSGSVHIEIRFERGEHGDGDPFDGPGGTLAHAYFPVYGGDAHFDDSERWTINSFSGTNLKQVAAHEFGHSLGLSHSDVRAALMAPFYRGYDPSLSLDEDDIEGIQALYGRKSRNTDSDSDSAGTSNRHSTTEAPTEEDAELCTSASVDTIFNSADGSTFAFKGQHFWKLTEESIAPGYPQRISKSWPGLPGDIDAAFTYKNGKTYFFKGSQYWRYTGRKMDGNYPKPISEGFTGIPDNLDAAFVWSGNGKIYFFKRDKFWRFDPSSRPPVKNTYPKPIANWEGLPNDLDAALQYTNGFTYFFKGGQYYRFNDRAFAVDVANPPFPRPAGYWWFGCRSATKGSALAGPSGEDRSPHDEEQPTPSTAATTFSSALCVLAFSLVLHLLV